MSHSYKVATCCYCGRRTELVLTGENMHELSCGSCGAPLHNLKRLKADADHAPAKVKKAKKSKPSKSAKSSGFVELAGFKAGKGKKKKRGYLLKEIFDVVEDIFD